jgi:hypothetical protein
VLRVALDEQGCREREEQRGEHCPVRPWSDRGRGRRSVTPDRHGFGGRVGRRVCPGADWLLPGSVAEALGAVVGAVLEVGAGAVVPADVVMVGDGVPVAGVAVGAVLARFDSGSFCWVAALDCAVRADPGAGSDGLVGRLGAAWGPSCCWGAGRKADPMLGPPKKGLSTRTR